MITSCRFPETGRVRRGGGRRVHSHPPAGQGLLRPVPEQLQPDHGLQPEAGVPGRHGATTSHVGLPIQVLP